MTGESATEQASPQFIFGLWLMRNQSHQIARLSRPWIFQLLLVASTLAGANTYCDSIEGATNVGPQFEPDAAYLVASAVYNWKIHEQTWGGIHASVEAAAAPLFAKYDDYPYPGQTLIVEKQLKHFHTSQLLSLYGYTWIVDFYNYEETQTKCDRDGKCLVSLVDKTVLTPKGDAIEAHRLFFCARTDPLPIKIALLGETHTITSGAKKPVGLVASVTSGGVAVANWPVTLGAIVQPTGPLPGHLVCETRHCPNYTSYSDAQGQVVLAFVPSGTTLAKTVTLTANCDRCQNTATWDVTLGSDTVIGFFNGVANTDTAAQKSLDRLKREFGLQYKETQLKYDWFYNQTACLDGWLGRVSCLEDVAETFEQRSLELDGVFANRWETFWDILAGRQWQETSFTGRLASLLGNGSNALLQWVDATANAAINQLASSFFKLLTLFTDSPSYENRSNHLERLTRYAGENSRLLLVAHSQGNLFVNSAFDALKSAKSDAQVQVVHVAPASPTLRGDYVLADIDLVINALRASGLNSVQNVNIHLPLSRADASGHGFEPTYLDTTRAAFARTIGMITASLETLSK